MDKVIKGFPNYTISMSGEITNILTGRIVSPYIATRSGKQYYCVNLFTGSEYNAVSKTVYIHRLVAEAWKESKDGCNIIRFKDGNTLNCKAINMELISQKELQKGVTRRGAVHTQQSRDKIRQANKGANNHRFKGWFVCEYKKYESAREAARWLKTTAKTVINRCKSGKYKGEGWYFIPKQ